MVRRPAARPEPWTPALLAALAGALVLVVTATTLLPGLRPAVPLALATAVPVVMLVGVRRHRPPTLGPWRLATAALAAWAVAAVAGTLGGEPWAVPAAALVSLSQVLAVGIVRAWYLVSQDPPGTDRAGVLDGLLAAAVVALVATRLVSSVLAGLPVSTLLSAASPLLDVVILSFMLQFAIARARYGTSSVLMLAGGFAMVAYDLLCTLSGARVPAADVTLSGVGPVGPVLFALAALHPSMRQTFEAARVAQRHRASRQLLGLLPLALVPACLAALNDRLPGLVQPTWQFQLAGAVVGALALLRGFAALRTTERHAARDALTGLLNRRGLADAFAGLSAGGSRATVLCVVDVDDFKRVNDSLGHEAGDELVVALAQRLTRTAGPAGVVARLGGDEFVVVVRADAAGPDPATVAALVCAEPFVVAGRPLDVRVSAGVAPGRPGRTLSESLADADVAMYAAKAGGKGRTAEFHESLRRQVLGRLVIADELRRLLGGTPDAGVGTLEVHYQPLVDTATGRADACEALVRWQHPVQGRILPDEFLAVAEEEGLGAHLDLLVLRTALAQLRRWEEDGLHLDSVSVNLGRSATCSPLLARDVLDACAAAGVAPRRLQLEITEHDRIPTEEGIRGQFARLTAAGVRVALDDFGTGYASLEYLLRFPITTLKLDRSLTAALLTDAASPLVSGVLGLASGLGIGVLAEGVETTVQRDRLQDLGITRGQGWLYAAALPAEEFARHVRGGDRAAAAPATTALATPGPV
nr:bifunctional diguanylate cyclase/phosphodiesterase [Kineococcus siccus]